MLYFILCAEFSAAYLSWNLLIICIVFAGVWSLNLHFAFYLQHFGAWISRVQRSCSMLEPASNRVARTRIWFDLYNCPCEKPSIPQLPLFEAEILEAKNQNIRSRKKPRNQKLQKPRSQRLQMPRNPESQRYGSKPEAGNKQKTSNQYPSRLNSAWWLTKQSKSV